MLLNTSSSVSLVILFIEIYNGTGEAIDLVNYAVTLYVNGVAESPNNKTFEFSSLLVI